MSKAKDLQYFLVVQMIVDGGLQFVDFEMAQKDYNDVKRQIRSNPTQLTFTNGNGEPVLVNVSGDRIFTAYTSTREKPKNIILPASDAVAKFAGKN